jgi:quercetin dioxygenase-like cupin family protein
MTPSRQQRSVFLRGKVRVFSLPVIKGPPRGTAPRLKRLKLPQGELAQVHDGEPGIQYVALIVFRPRKTRGNHFHKFKVEYVYVIRGQVKLVVEEVTSKARATVKLRQGDQVVISTGVAHALRPLTAGQALEFSPAPFDQADSYAYPLVA